MRILKLHHPTGHPYWQKKEYKVELPNGTFVDLSPLYHYDHKSTGYEIYVQDGNVYFHECACGSGFGKVRIDRFKPIMVVSKKDYDILEYVGKELAPSPELLADLKENQLI